MNIKSMFTNDEIKDLIVSLLVVAFVFSYPKILNNPLFFIVSVGVIGLSFVIHELAHKFIAIKLGYIASYRMWKQGLIIALLFTFLTNGKIIFAAPGAVVFYSAFFFYNPKKDEVGLIGLAGPLANIAMMYIFIIISGFGEVFSYIAVINGWLAVFNLIPFGPLDGYKVFKWNYRIWLISLIIAISGFLFVIS